MKTSTKFFLIGAVVGPLVFKFAGLILTLIGVIAIGWAMITVMEMKAVEQDEMPRQITGEPEPGEMPMGYEYGEPSQRDDNRA